MNKSISILLTLLGCSACAWQQVVHAGPITADSDGTGTQVSASGGNPNQFDIDGGTQAGQNLFHSFEKFGLSQNQIANFMSNSEIQNILGRVTGGQASNIDGLLRVTGSNANLYLMNPAGMIFGPNARLDLGGSFTATTATGIQIDDVWFNAFGSNNYEQLIGNPQAFAFAGDELGAVVNAGTLEVSAGESVTLLGGTVINTGTISAEGGDITIAAVPEEQVVRITPEGALLSLDLPMETRDRLLADVGEFEPLKLPELLTGGGYESAAGVMVADGKVILTGSETVIPEDAGAAIASGRLDASNAALGEIGGDVNVLGELVGVVDASIDASGDGGGGKVLIGGDYKGEGVVPNSKQTFVGAETVIEANALGNGDGGQVITWANNLTEFYGNISARGGDEIGDGGFVEVSGKENLVFDGNIDVSAINGSKGTILFDPRNIFIVQDPEIGDIQLEPNIPLGQEEGEIRENDSVSDKPNTEDFTISASRLSSIEGNIILEAKNDIVISDGVSIIFETVINEGDNETSIIFKANSDRIDGGSFFMDPNQIIDTKGRSIYISGNTITTGNINATNSVTFDDNGRVNFFGSNSGNVTLKAIGDIQTGFIHTIVIDNFEEDNSVVISSSNGSVIVNGFVSADKKISIESADKLRILDSRIPTITEGFFSASFSDQSGNIAGISLFDFFRSKGISFSESKIFRVEFTEIPPGSIIIEESQDYMVLLNYGNRLQTITNISKESGGRVLIQGGDNMPYTQGPRIEKILDSQDPFVFRDIETNEFVIINRNNFDRLMNEEVELFFNILRFKSLDTLPENSNGLTGAILEVSSDGDAFFVSYDNEFTPLTDIPLDSPDFTDSGLNRFDNRNFTDVVFNRDGNLIECNSPSEIDICQQSPDKINILDISEFIESN